MDTYSQLRKDFPEFVYESYSYTFTENELELHFIFSCGKYTFNPSLKIPHQDCFFLRSKTNAELNNLVFHLGMVELISYWKSSCSPTLIVKPHLLTFDQIKFWKKLYFKGLGEFFYRNGISTTIDSFMQIENASSTGLRPFSVKWKEGTIIPIGGGKDSAVTWELLKPSEGRKISMIINPGETTDRFLSASNVDPAFSTIIYRTIDPLLLELNKKGHLNGHTPFSALIAFSSLLISYLTRIKNVALSNESSANESTIPGTEVNHQYSKTFEFENDFRVYVRSYIIKEHNYFSFLRPINELKIASLFACFPQYFDLFKSCNVGSKTSSWCLNCPKCLFTFIILSPFIDLDTLCQRIFGKNLLDDPKMEKDFLDLIGVGETKPFECIGTIDEINEALALFYAKSIQKDSNFQPPYLLKKWLSVKTSESYLQRINRLPDAPSYSNHNLKKNYTDLLFPFVENPIGIPMSKFLSDKRILILGFGREGKSSYRILRKILPEQTLFIADANPLIAQSEETNGDPYSIFLTGTNYLACSNSFDLILKSPGISGMELKKFVDDAEKISSQTDLFLRFFASQTIGITGTKGKTTTSSLTYEILKEKTSNVLFAGNVGIPVFDIIPKIQPNTIIVLELSSHQLEDITVAPKFSVVLNLFEEHLDHYESFKDYQAAKMNICLKQTDDDLFIYDADNKELQKWEPKINDQKTIITLHKEEYTLIDSPFFLGDHNKKNFMAAMHLARAFDISIEQINKIITSFRNLNHRMEFVGEFNEISFYNDSIATIPESTIAAIETLKNVDTIILGGLDRKINYKPLGEFLSSCSIRNFVFLGEAGKRIYESMTWNNGKNYIFEQDMPKIVTWCFLMTLKGKKCLLSPAAASYDLFQNFEERGNLFKQTVLNFCSQSTPNA